MLRSNNLQAAQHAIQSPKEPKRDMKLTSSNRRAEHYCTGCLIVIMGNLSGHMNFLGLPLFLNVDSRFNSATVFVVHSSWP